MKYWDKTEHPDARFCYTLKSEYREVTTAPTGAAYTVWVSTAGKEPYLYTSRTEQHGVPLQAWRELMADIVDTVYA